jgi:hypothetical protein
MTETEVGIGAAVPATDERPTGPPVPVEPDVVLAAAVDLARVAAVETGGEDVGEHIGLQAEEELLVTHHFSSTLPGYVGWYWAVSLVRAPEQDEATVAEVVLLPGAEALLAPAWVPWNERLKTGDLGPGDLLPPIPDDPRLVPAYASTEDEDAERVAYEIGLGRERVLSREGRAEAAERWYDGEWGPDTPMARQAPAPCGTCGFLVPLAGSLQGGFGACGNEISPADGRVVSVAYGCGAHSQAQVEVPSLAEPVGWVYETGEKFGFESNESAVEVPAVEAFESPEAPVETPEESEGATLAAVLGHDQVAGDAEQPTVEAGPEPDAMAVVVEPAPEAGQNDGGEEEEGGSDEDHPASIDS